MLRGEGGGGGKGGCQENGGEFHGCSTTLSTFDDIMLWSPRPSPPQPTAAISHTTKADLAMRCIKNHKYETPKSKASCTFRIVSRYVRLP